MPNKCEYSQLRFEAKLIKTPIFKDTRKLDILVAPKGTRIKVIRDMNDCYEISVVSTAGEKKSMKNVQLGEHGVVLKSNIKNHWRIIE
jgi:hypothetical protein